MDVWKERKNMSMAWIGSIGVGIVWGWLAGQVIVRKSNLIINVASLAVGTSLIIIQIYLLTDLLAITAFAFAIVCAFTAYMSWIYKLRQIANKV